MVTKALLIDEEARGMYSPTVLRLLKSAQTVRGERRRDHARRKRVDQMTRAEMQRELMTDELTGLPNARAFNETQKQPTVVMFDVDGLKWFNDEHGHAAGDALLRAVAQTLVWADVEAYRIHGDEFYINFGSYEEASAMMKLVAERFRQTAFAIRDRDGKLRIFNGAEFTYGIGTNTRQAADEMAVAKQIREKSGLRTKVRGGRPPALLELNPALDPLAKPWGKGRSFVLVN